MNQNCGNYGLHPEDTYGQSILEAVSTLLRSHGMGLQTPRQETREPTAEVGIVRSTTTSTDSLDGWKSPQAVRKNRKSSNVGSLPDTASKKQCGILSEKISPTYTFPPPNHHQTKLLQKLRDHLTSSRHHFGDEELDAWLALPALPSSDSCDLGQVTQALRWHPCDSINIGKCYPEAPCITPVFELKVPVDDEQRDLDYETYMRSRQEVESAVIEGVVLAKTESAWVRFDRWINSFAKEHVIELGVWHSEYEKARKIDSNLAPPIRTEVYPDKRWIVKEKDGDCVCYLEDMPIRRPELGGPSQENPGMAYAQDETRPRKELRLSRFMDYRTLQYVDLELFTTLKMVVLATGVVATTHATLYKKAESFFKAYRTDHYHPALMAEVILWTVEAAKIPTNSEILSRKLMSKPKLYKIMKDTTEYKRTGATVASRLFGLGTKRLNLFQNKPV